ncbi:DUF7527 domain-containing protein [Halovivax cerinus]|uniref:DUF7527 domain-containing protein n=1 Tax=Halovivax cerinus TaxID=1487865 RepID=A0ABD5NIL6_9EURY|nr:hypothetical protein [Halovivax cerinus]
MDPRTKERVERWESRPFSGGEDALATLADDAFSGAVTAAGVWVFMLNGRIVGVVDGSIDAVAGTSGTIYEAPAAVLPLLSAMLEQGGDPRGRYYTNDTPLAAVDRKLQQGSFTGYVELSEQVLSGDYYLVYYGGRRMSAAYIGNAERLETGEVAFERADDEIGIYEVVDVDVDVSDVPGRETADESQADEPATGSTLGSQGADDTPDGPSSAAGSSTTESSTGGPDPAGSADAAGPAGSDGRPGSTPAGDTAAAHSAGPDGSSTAQNSSRATDSETDGDRHGDSTAQSGPPTADRTDSETEVNYREDSNGSAESSQTPDDGVPSSADTAQSSSGATDEHDSITTSGETHEPQSDGITTSGTDASTADRSDLTTTASDAGTSGANARQDESAESDAPDERFKEEERWRETRQIPSIDPESSGEQSSAGHGSADGGSRSKTERSTARDRPSPADVASTEQALRSDMLEREDKIDHLTQRVTELEEKRKQLVRERDELASENDDLTERVSRLQSRIEELERDLERAQSASEPDATGGKSGGATDAARTGGREAQSVGRTDQGGTTISPTRALQETNVFVRYASKSQPTLESAHEGEGSRGDLERNLRLERHTQFDAETAVVDGEPYDAFVEGSMQYRFVEWLVGTCLFEIRETGNAADLADLYDAIPRIDRVELSATVSLEDDDTENVPDQVTFDVGAFDKRGTPLVVANCNDSRDPATQGMLEELEADASSVCANYPDLAAAVVVTSSFFDPGALELAEEITTSGFLSRSSKVSYVNLSRKQGYHCCLVESRSGGFHLTVPEL